MKTPKIGDRVRLFNCDRFAGRKGTIIDLEPIGCECATILLDNSTLRYSLTWAQCRKLIKKERKRVWIKESSYVSLIYSATGQVDTSILDRERKGWIEFVKVKKK